MALTRLELSAGCGAAWAVGPVCYWGDHRWLLISTEALGVGQRGGDSDSWGGAASETQPGHVSTPGQQDPSPELGCAGVGSPGSRQSRAPGDLSPWGLAGCWQGLAEGTGPLTLHLGAPPLPTWPSRPGKE